MMPTPKDERYEARLVALRAAIDEGIASGIAKGDVFRRAHKKLQLPASAR
jgi:hypothetical protein